MKTKHFAIIEFALIVVAVMLLVYASSGSCDPTLVYPVIIVIAVQIAGMAVLFGVYLKLSSRQNALPGINQPAGKTAQATGAKKLKGHEKYVYKIIKNADGAVLQEVLIKKTGLSKVRVTRVLNKLEGKGLIERKRKGPRNVVLLRNK
jgi:uncharacterized membrane protein